MSKMKYLIMDVDGTLTDGKIYMGESGEVFKAFDIKDGCGIHDLAIPNGIVPVIITGRKSKILENRCRELGIKEVYQGISNKTEKMLEVIQGDNLEKVAYMGDDLNDVGCMLEIKNGGGVIGCPNDAVDSVKRISDFISLKNGGEGAVREFIEYLLESEM